MTGWERPTRSSEGETPGAFHPRGDHVITLLPERPNKPFIPLGLDELFALQLPDLEFAVDEILPLGAATLLTAREKAGKGLLTIDLLASIAAGEPYLDRAVRMGPAIYMPAEEHVRDVRDRIAARIGDRRDIPLLVLPLNGFTEDRLRLTEPNDLARLRRLLIDVEPVAIVLDTFRELHDRAEDSADEMGPLLRPLRELAHDTNVAIVLNHHQNKGGSFRGSTAIRAAFDQEWSFRRTDTEGVTSGEGASGVITIDGRYAPRQEIGVRLGSGLRWEASGVLAVPTSGSRDRLLACLAAAPAPLTAEAIAEAIGAEKKTIQNAISQMLGQDQPPIRAIGTGRRDDPRRFEVAA